MAADARHAASVLVLRDGPDGIEVLFVRRSDELKFMGGAWVFPGGALHSADGDAQDDSAHRRCAVRETQEEAGLELGDPTLLVPFSRWITPEPAPIRFDTRFYLARAPQNATATPDRREVDHAEWWTCAKALELYVDDEVQIHFPTIKQIEPLAGFATVQDALAAAAQLEIKPVLPRIVAGDDGFDILLPGDPGYDDAA
ncbi:MAG: NUDIX domain-containing protein [Actinobacteria bacterium]|nr:NUDIX domain-containing protein [Actinomycetota bacterium]